MLRTTVAGLTLASIFVLAYADGHRNEVPFPITIIAMGFVGFFMLKLFLRYGR